MLTPGIQAMTFGRWIFVRRGCEHHEQLLAHEAVHVRQYAQLGWWRFLVAYLAAYVRGRRSGLGHWDAYRAIPFEREARREAGEE